MEEFSENIFLIWASTCVILIKCEGKNNSCHLSEYLQYHLFPFMSPNIYYKSFLFFFFISIRWYTITIIIILEYYSLLFWFQRMNLISCQNQQCLLFLGPNFSFQAQLFLSNHLFLVSSTRLHLYFVVKTPVLGKLLFLIISFVIISRFFQYLDANASWLNSVILNYPIKSSFAFILLILLFGGFSK